MKIDVREVLEMKRKLAVYNSVAFDKCEFYDGERRLEVTAAEAEDWEFSGLNNTSFVEIALADRLPVNGSESFGMKLTGRLDALGRALFGDSIAKDSCSQKEELAQARERIAKLEAALLECRDAAQKILDYNKSR